MAKTFLGVEFLTEPEVRQTLEEHEAAVASPLKRIGAYLVDTVLTLFLASVVMVPCGLAYSGFGIERGEGEKLAKTVFFFWAWSVFPLYYAVFSSIFGRTFGCWIFRIKIIRMSGKPIGLIYGFLRGFYIGTITAIVFPYTLIAHTILSTFDWRGGRLKLSGWDILSRTIVIHEINQPNQ